MGRRRLRLVTMPPPFGAQIDARTSLSLNPSSPALRSAVSSARAKRFHTPWRVLNDISVLSKFSCAAASQGGLLSTSPKREGTMTTDLQYLAYTALLTASLWIVYIAAQVTTNGFLAPENYVDPAPVRCRSGVCAPIAPISTRLNPCALRRADPDRACRGQGGRHDRVVRNRLLLAGSRVRSSTGWPCPSLAPSSSLWGGSWFWSSTSRSSDWKVVGEEHKRPARINPNPP